MRCSLTLLLTTLFLGACGEEHLDERYERLDQEQTSREGMECISMETSWVCWDWGADCRWGYYDGCNWYECGYSVFSSGPYESWDSCDPNF